MRHPLEADPRRRFDARLKRWRTEGYHVAAGVPAFFGSEQAPILDSEALDGFRLKLRRARPLHSIEGGRHGRLTQRWQHVKLGSAIVYADGESPVAWHTGILLQADSIAPQFECLRGVVVCEREHLVQIEGPAGGRAFDLRFLEAKRAIFGKAHSRPMEARVWVAVGGRSTHVGARGGRPRELQAYTLLPTAHRRERSRAEDSRVRAEHLARIPVDTRVLTLSSVLKAGGCDARLARALAQAPMVHPLDRGRRSLLLRIRKSTRRRHTCRFLRGGAVRHVHRRSRRRRRGGRRRAGEGRHERGQQLK